MRVLIDTTFARRGPSGTGVYISKLVPALRALGVEAIEASNPRRRQPGGGGRRSAANYAVDEWWTAVELPRLARQHDADVLHHPLPALAARAPCPQVVTVHDLAFERLPWAFAPRYRAWARRAHRRAARRAAAVVCPSQATALDVRSRWGVSPTLLEVAPHGPGQLDEPLPRAPQPAHFVYVGDDEPRKNLGTLLAAYRAYRTRSRVASAALPLVLAGRASARGEGIVHHPEPDLRRLHAAAAALVHPSLHEGFGLTVLEAMRAGTPIIAGASAAVAELAGEAAGSLLDPRDADAFAAAMLAPPDGEPGRIRAQAFTWERSARAHVKAYTVALDRR